MREKIIQALEKIEKIRDAEEICVTAYRQAGMEKEAAMVKAAVAAFNIAIDVIVRTLAETDDAE